jgi:hypothetical protein
MVINFIGGGWKEMLGKGWRFMSDEEKDEYVNSGEGRLLTPEQQEWKTRKWAVPFKGQKDYLNILFRKMMGKKE